MSRRPDESLPRTPRHDWTREEVGALYHRPLLDLVFEAQQIHRQYHPPSEVQLCRLLSI
ncbi:MAG: biotin synthase BioB, partial [Terriglobia bacterium]